MRRSSFSKAILLLTCTALGACQAAAPGQTSDSLPQQGHLRDDQIKIIGQQYLDGHYPQWKDEYSLPSVVIDHGDYWEYTFDLSSGTIGGTPVVYIDKNSLKVTKVFSRTMTFPLAGVCAPPHSPSNTAADIGPFERLGR